MFKGKDNWYDIWVDDKKSLLDTMVKNMAADLTAGYDYFGNCIAKQRMEIDLYKNEFYAQLDSFVNMTDEQINKWCYFDLLKRGSIE